MNETRSIWDYEDIVERGLLEDLELLAEHISGRVLHVNATYSGGGVAEILSSMIPLLKGLDIETDWNIIRGDDAFFSITKTFHNVLHGRVNGAVEVPVEHEPVSVLDDLKSEIGELTRRKEMFETYLHWNKVNSEEMDLDSDFVFIHDPQPAALIDVKQRGKWIWRCHIDVSNPDPLIWNFLKEPISKYDASIFSTPMFARPDLGIREFLVPPSIDPLSDKNIELSQGDIGRVLDKYGICMDKPIITQVSRFDRLKDLPGVIDAYKLVKKRIDCQLILAGGVASDDPEGMGVYREVMEKADGEEDIHVLLGSPPFSDIEINAFQRASTVIMQKSLKEGFGLVVSEGLWKGKPVIGGATGGIPLQLVNDVTGYLVHSVDGAAFKIANLLKNPELSQRLGEAGKEHVRHNFLITRHLKDYLLIMLSLENPSGTIRLSETCPKFH